MADCRLKVGYVLAGMGVLAAGMVFFGSAAHAASQGRQATAKFDGRRAFEDLQELVRLGERTAATEGAAQAAEFIARRLRDAGIQVRLDSFSEDTPWGRGRFTNVMGIIPGQCDSVVIIGGHYDTKAGIGRRFQGANDSGSSTAVLLEIARVLAACSGQRMEKWVVFFDGEECRRSYGPHDGLHGSRRLARRLIQSGAVKRIRAAVIVDMVGDRDLELTIPPNCSTSLVSLLQRCAADRGFEGLVRSYPGPILDDHVPFLRCGIPAIDIIDFYYGSAPGRNDYWHTLEDSLEHVSARSLETVGRIVVEMVRRLDDCEQMPARK